MQLLEGLMKVSLDLRKNKLSFGVELSRWEWRSKMAEIHDLCCSVMVFMVYVALWLHNTCAIGTWVWVDWCAIGARLVSGSQCNCSVWSNVVTSASFWRLCCWVISYLVQWTVLLCMFMCKSVSYCIYHSVCVCGLVSASDGQVVCVLACSSCTPQLPAGHCVYSLIQKVVFCPQPCCTDKCELWFEGAEQRFTPL